MTLVPQCPPLPRNVDLRRRPVKCGRLTAVGTHRPLHAQPDPAAGRPRAANCAGMGGAGSRAATSRGPSVRVASDRTAGAHGDRTRGGWRCRDVGWRRADAHAHGGGRRWRHVKRAAAAGLHRIAEQE
eukprot:scaffold20426_cov146-Isochrysis_galbana.AAC.3